MSLKFTGVAALLATLAVTAWALASSPSDADPQSIARGRYIARIAGCNDCHTPGYVETAGDVPETNWLVGTTVGWRGDWEPRTQRIFACTCSG